MRFGLLSGLGPRLDGFSAALTSRGHPAPTHLTYEQFIADPESLKDILERVDILRIDSPGGGYDIWKCFADYVDLPTTGYEKQHGQIYTQAPFVQGTYQAIKSASDMAATQDVTCMVDPEAVKCFMDKQAAHELCSGTITMPERLPSISSWADLDRTMNAKGLTRVFMKLRYGSAASGVIAIETKGSRLRLWTSVERVEGASGAFLFNSLKIRKYLDDDARRLIDQVAMMGVHTERWIPKLRIDNKPCDLRLVVVGGEPVHRVVRCSGTPLTNLHLGNERMSAEAMREILSETVWAEILDMGKRAGALFPKHLCIGIDIAVHKETRNPYLLEINAFGDHLNRVYYDGLDPYEYQIRYLETKFA